MTFELFFREPEGINTSGIIGFSVGVILFILVSLYACYLLRNSNLLFGALYFGAITIIFTITLLFSVPIAPYIMIALMAVSLLTVIFSIMNKSSLSHIGLKLSKGRKKSRIKVSKVYNKEELFTEISEAVAQLSQRKIGALITFERNAPIDEYLKNGVAINAPVSKQLLGTIFYPGTPLHDGAVIIRKNIIIAASVYFSPTTKPMRGKLGSRHRAAIGISEVSDAVTIVVSEETGRISFTANGEIEEVMADHVYRTLEDYMDN